MTVWMGGGSLKKYASVMQMALKGDLASFCFSGAQGVARDGMPSWNGGIVIFVRPPGKTVPTHMMVIVTEHSRQAMPGMMNGVRMTPLNSG